jgi:hypothetical protein
MSTFRLSEGGCEYEVVEADSLDSALVLARENLDPSAYTVDSTIWVQVQAVHNDTEESASAKVRLDPPEPKCSGKKHSWKSPHALVGGIKSNPGVFAHGGGVVIHEVCMACGCERVTDTWAQDMTDGEQGLQSVRYEPGKYSEEVEHLQEELPPTRRTGSRC